MKPLVLLTLMVVAVAGYGVGAGVGGLSASAAATTTTTTSTDPIIGFWNYGGGVVQVSGSNGSFTGVIVKATMLQTCVHEVGETMWQISGGNGSYTGSHLGWSTTDCTTRESQPAQWTINGDTLDAAISTCSGPLGSCGVNNYTLTLAKPVTPVWPPLPSALVNLNSVSNGCGGGVASNEPRFADTSTFLNSNDPLGKRYVVNFRLACNMHDAGYSGAKVEDPINGGTFDYFSSTRQDVDTDFLRNMRTLCARAFKGTGATVALADCMGSGGKTSAGAQTRYKAVHAAGSVCTVVGSLCFYEPRPNLAGTWSGVGVSDLVIAQTGRSVTGTWQNGPVSGAFRGTLISRDQDSVIEGFAQTVVNGVTQPQQPAIKITINPTTPNMLVVNAGPGLPGTLTR